MTCTERAAPSVLNCRDKVQLVMQSNKFVDNLDSTQMNLKFVQSSRNLKKNEMPDQSNKIVNNLDSTRLKLRKRDHCFPESSRRSKAQMGMNTN
eukprot:scaffold387_cov266-Chaetoceros_neogracile.AAC.20